ncbi:hypothetical protein [Nostoc sp. DedQUE07]|uniref:hypothetical protein n=1 Tax=Nostoc sp. DedQUE07 TaxID=3075392 RepID=UPI002AD253C0|nr:hypothetical protein [Nostoc sp. DedQUE07]MDZ8127261.1 hypothetical protein [Nostoc sp. DedQUE07]
MKFFNVDFGLVQTPLILAFVMFALNIPVHAQKQYNLPEKEDYKHSLSVKTQCFQDLQRDISAERVARLCRNSTRYTSQCFQELRNSTSLEHAEKLCRIATPYTSQCFQDLRNVTSTEQATRLCNFALEDTNQCFRVLNQQMSTNRAEQECLPPLTSVLQACVDSLTFDAQGHPTGISETIAAINCQETLLLRFPRSNSDWNRD